MPEKLNASEHLNRLYKLVRELTQKMGSQEKALKSLRAMAQRKKAPGGLNMDISLEGRIGRARHPGCIPVERTYIKKLTGSGDFGSSAESFSAEITVPDIEELYMFAMDFGLVKPDTNVNNTGLVNCWLPLSAKRLMTYQTASPATEQYVGRDFFWGVALKSGNRRLQNDILRPSADCEKHHYGYVFPEDILVPKSHTIRVDAIPLSAASPWVPDGETQSWDLYAIFRMYEMLHPDYLISD